MNTIFSLLQFLTFYSFISLIRANSNYPLIYNPVTSVLYNTEKLDIQSVTYPVFSACPPKGNEEEELNRNHSLNQKALFIRKFYTRAEDLDDIIRCESNFELAVVRDANTFGEKIEFGHEAYFEPSLLPKDVDINVYLERVSRFESITGKYVSIESPPLTKNRPTKFIWVKRIELLYNTGLWNARSVNYSLHRSVDKINVQCDDYNLGKEHFAKKNVYSYYTKENVKKIFDDVELPEDSKCQSSEDGCIEKYNLLMPHHFQPAPWLPTSCSEISSVPIWSEVSKELLDYSEKFLNALSQVTEHKLNIISGVFETLSLPYKNQPIKSKNIYLNQTDSIFPVPRAFYKIVSYQSHKCRYTRDICWFHAVIVIHNELELKKEENLCSRDKCEEWGWESIQYMNTSSKGEKSKHVYCCKMDRDMEMILDKPMDSSRSDDLNLMFFPVYNEKENEVVNVNKKEEVLKIMDTLLSTSKS